MPTTEFNTARSSKLWTKPVRPALPNCPLQSSPRKPSDERLAVFRFRHLLVDPRRPDPYSFAPHRSPHIPGTKQTMPPERIDVSPTDIPKANQPEPTPEPKPEPKKLEKITAPKLVKKTELARVKPKDPPPKLEQLPPPPELTAPGPEKGSVASKAPAGEAAGGEAGVGGLVWGGGGGCAGGGGMGGGGGGGGSVGCGRGG